MSYNKGIDIDTIDKIIDLKSLFGRNNELQVEVIGDNVFIDTDNSFIRTADTTTAYTGLAKKSYSEYRVNITNADTILKKSEIVEIVSGSEKHYVKITEVTPTNAYFILISSKNDIKDIMTTFATGNIVANRDTKLVEGNIFSLDTSRISTIVVKSEGISSLEFTVSLKKKS